LANAADEERSEVESGTKAASSKKEREKEKVKKEKKEKKKDKEKNREKKEKRRKSKAESDDEEVDLVPALTVVPTETEAASTGASETKATSGDSTSVFKLSDLRQLSVRTWKGKVNIDIREYYSSGGELKPGNKGISLTVDQWKRLQGYVADINQAVSKLSIR